MAVDESLDALSTTAASNTPLGTDNVGTDLDDNLRDIKKNIRIAAEHAQGILNPTGFEGQLHADKSRSASGIVTLRLYHDEWNDLFEFDTASTQIKVINLDASAIPGLAVRASEFSASEIAAVALNLGALSASEIPSVALNISPLAVTRGGIGQESSASASAYIQALINPASVPISAAQGGTGQESSASSSAYINVMLGTLLALSRKATVGDADIAISSEATGDIIVHGGAGGDWNRFGIGSTSEMLHVSGGTWALRSPPSGVSQATQAALEAETNQNTYAPPDLIKHSPGIAKCWANFDVTGTLNASYNVASITDNGTGDWSVNIDTNMSSGNYSVAAVAHAANPASAAIAQRHVFDSSTRTKAAGVFHILCVDGGTAADEKDPTNLNVAAYGDQ